MKINSSLVILGTLLLYGNVGADDLSHRAGEAKISEKRVGDHPVAEQKTAEPEMSFRELHKELHSKFNSNKVTDLVTIEKMRKRFAKLPPTAMRCVVPTVRKGRTIGYQQKDVAFRTYMHRGTYRKDPLHIYGDWQKLAYIESNEPLLAWQMNELYSNRSKSRSILTGDVEPIERESDKNRKWKDTQYEKLKAEQEKNDLLSGKLGYYGTEEGIDFRPDEKDPNHFYARYFEDGYCEFYLDGQ